MTRVLTMVAVVFLAVSIGNGAAEANGPSDETVAASDDDGAQAHDGSAEYGPREWRSLLGGAEGRPAVIVTVDGEPRTGLAAGSILRALATETVVRYTGSARRSRSLLEVAVRARGGLQAEVAPEAPQPAPEDFGAFFRRVTNDGATPLHAVAIDRKKMTVIVTVGRAGSASPVRETIKLGVIGWNEFAEAVGGVKRLWRGQQPRRLLPLPGKLRVPRRRR